MPARTNNDQWLKDQCNRYKNGQCTTLACVMRGGYKIDQDLQGKGDGYDPEIATCEAHEILCELAELRTLLDSEVDQINKLNE